jgi:ADP-heptose:LPS heptosyltransferase
MKIDKEKIKKILLIRPEMIGDYVIITPVITALKQAFPAATITIFIKEFTLPLVKTNPDIDDIIIDPNQIMSGHFDLAIDFFGQPQYAWLIFKAGIPYRLGDGSRLLNNIFYNVRTFINWRDFTKHYVELYAQFLRPLGITLKNIKYHIQPTAAALAAAEKILPHNNYIGLHLGAGGNRSWTAQNFAQLTNLITSQLNLPVVLLGSKKEEEKADQLLALCQAKPLNLVNKLSLPQLVAALSKLSVYIGTDTGPFHIAAGLGVPIVALMFSKFFKPAQWGPWGTRHIILRTNNPCKKLCDPRICRDTTCVTRLSAAQVLAALKTILAGGGNRTIEESKQDWLKKSLNILLIGERNRPAAQQIYEILVNHDYNVNRSVPLPFHKLQQLFIEKDINLLHCTDPGFNLKLKLACQLAGLKLKMPVLYVQTNRSFTSCQDLINLYTSQFERKPY